MKMIFTDRIPIKPGTIWVMKEWSVPSRNTIVLVLKTTDIEDVGGVVSILEENGQVRVVNYGYLRSFYRPEENDDKD